MPITPFHFGPGLLIKSVAGRHFSWLAFVLANILIDLEPIGFFLLTGEPVHPYLHTYVGALGLGLLVALLGRRPCEAWIMLWNVRLRPPEMAWTRVSPSVTSTAVASGGLLGTLSHVMIDSIMHVDVHPWKPLLPDNSMQGLVSIDELHLWCIGAGLIGGALLYIARVKARINPPH